MSDEDSGIAEIDEPGRTLPREFFVSAIDRPLSDICTDMNTHKPILLAAGLCLAACADIPVRNSTRDVSVSNAKLSVANAKLTVHIVEAANPG